MQSAAEIKLMQEKPQLISLQKIDLTEIEYSITIAEVKQHIPFEIKRMYLLRSGKNSLRRGRHAHVNSKQVLIVISGSLHITLTSLQKRDFSFDLNEPSKALFIPANYWLEFDLAPHSVVLCLSSQFYDDQITLYNSRDFFSQNR